MSAPTSSHAYGIGIMAVIIGAAVGVGYYQMYYLPESLAKPKVSHEILEPVGKSEISIIMGSANPEQVDNFIPKLVNIQLGVDNHVVWTNNDDTAHTVTPDHRMEDSYSGDFGSLGVIKPGETYEFLFTEANVVEYHCTPHPWMKGSLEITKQRF
ncbi:plastocyanin/azurin family copper-binding protein [Candidatus Nitrosotenuis chungbukensis]|uniref:cupredoxin domain-containing protein n=1 Tax=Candidatus Nitrosotenuis chungbukensis TaxID=1353246 RepID=UPI0005B25EFD|nr:plastocyanin/azurin family copper-binding protein [Candidatus Nitrosotenuis chungbukensis]WKT58734.1 plastocyanin/azurin family copper-binding protein [Candidatus Nitrosotenuis chungbukensis]